MKKLIYIALAITVLASCSAEKKMIRQQNRAARLVEKAKRIDPNIAKERTELIPVRMKSPQVQAQIRQSIAGPLVNELPHRTLTTQPASPSNTWSDTPRDTSAAIVFPMFFDDDSISARISIDGAELVLDYTINPQPCDTVVEIEYEYIEPTRRDPLPLSWWQRIRITAGDLALIFLLAYILYRVMLRQLNKY